MLRSRRPKRDVISRQSRIEKPDEEIDHYFSDLPGPRIRLRFVLQEQSSAQTASGKITPDLCYWQEREAIGKNARVLSLGTRMENGAPVVWPSVSSMGRFDALLAP